MPRSRHQSRRHSYGTRFRKNRRRMRSDHVIVAWPWRRHLVLIDVTCLQPDGVSEVVSVERAVSTFVEPHPYLYTQSATRYDTLVLRRQLLHDPRRASDTHKLLPGQKIYIGTAFVTAILVRTEIIRYNWNNFAFASPRLGLCRHRNPRM